MMAGGDAEQEAHAESCYISPSFFFQVTLGHLFGKIVLRNETADFFFMAVI